MPGARTALRFSLRNHTLPLPPKTKRCVKVRVSQDCINGENLNATYRLRQRSWDLVVLQDQSQVPALFDSAGARDFVASRDAARHLASLAPRGAELWFLATWAHRDGDTVYDMKLSHDAMQARIDTGYNHYRDAVRRAGGSAEVARVSGAWSQLARNHSMLYRKLYKSDGRHPTPRGLYLAACVLYATLLRESPVGLGWAPKGVGAADRLVLQQTAALAASERDRQEHATANKPFVSARGLATRAANTSCRSSS